VVDEGDNVAIFTDSDGDWELWEDENGVGQKVVTNVDDGSSVTYRLKKQFTLELVPNVEGIFGKIGNSTGIKLKNTIKEEYSGRFFPSESEEWPPIQSLENLIQKGLRILPKEGWRILKREVGKLFEIVIEFDCDVAIEKLERGTFGEGMWQYISMAKDWTDIDNSELGEGEYLFLRKGDKIKFVPTDNTWGGYGKAFWHDIKGVFVVNLNDNKNIKLESYKIEDLQDFGRHKHDEWYLCSEITKEFLSGIKIGEPGQVCFERYRTVMLVVKGDIDRVEINNPDVLDGIRIQSSDNVWIEGENRYANYIIGGPDEDDTKVPYEIKYLWDKFYTGESPAFNPTGMVFYDYGDGVSNPVNEADLNNIKSLARKGQVKLAKGDTFNTQEGNIYDFGGYWNYNLGNSYAEEHIDQSADLNTLKNGELSIENFAPKDPNFSAPNLLGLATTMGGGGAAIMMAAIVASGGGGAKSVGATVASFIGAIQGMAQVIAIGSDLDKDLSDAPRMIQNGDQCNLGDIVTCPNFGNIKTWAGKVGSSFNFPDGDVPNENGEQLQQLSGKEFYNNAKPMHTATTWVTKNFGDSYSFTKGNSIEIANGSIETHNHGNTYEFTYGGRHEEQRFSGGGGQVYYSCSEGGKSFEQKWTPSGNIVSIDYKDASVVWGQGLAYAFSSTHTGKIDVSFAMGVSASISASADAHLNISSSLGANFNIESAAAANFNIKFGGAANFTIENDKMETNIVGLREIKSGKYIKNVGLEKKNALESIKTAAKDISNGDKKIDTFSNAVLAAMNILLG
jgi:hypothetical protein